AEFFRSGAADQRTDRVAQAAVDATGKARQLGPVLRRHRDERFGSVVGEEAPLSLPLGGREELPERMQHERAQAEERQREELLHRSTAAVGALPPALPALRAARRPATS